MAAGVCRGGSLDPPDYRIHRESTIITGRRMAAATRRTRSLIRGIDYTGHSCFSEP